MLELNKVYQGNCNELIKSIDDNSIDIIITSPPYNKAGYEGFIRKRHSKDSWGKRNIDYDNVAENDFMIEEDYQKWQIEFLNECYRVLKPNGSMFYNHKIRVAKHKASHPIEWILKSKLIFRQQITWDRGNSPAVAPIRYLPTTELIFWLTKEQKQPNFYRNKECEFLTEVWRINASHDKSHPASFPIELVDNILCNIPNDGNIVVLDPFAGIGKTLISAKTHNMNYIGFDISNKYCDETETILNDEVKS